MKTLLFLFTSFLLLSCNPYKHMAINTNFPVPFEFKLIDSIVGTQNDLYVKANEWMAKTFVSAKEVIQMQDKEAGKLIGKGIIETPVLNAYGTNIGVDYVHYTISIDVKEGRYRCILSDFYHEGALVNYGGKYGLQNTPSYGSLNNAQPSNYGNMMQSTVNSQFAMIKDVSMKKANELLLSLKNAMHFDAGKF